MHTAGFVTWKAIRQIVVVNYVHDSITGSVLG